MTENEEFYKLTFSQREGKAPLPEPMHIEHVSEDFRHLVWRAVDNSIKREIRRHPNFGYYYYERKDSMYHIISEYTIKVLHWPHDYIKHVPHMHQELLRGKILEENYDLVLTLIEFILRHNCCPQQLRKDLKNAFKELPLAYAVQTINHLPTIVPHSSEESGTSTQQAIETIEQKGPAGAKTHLHDAAKAINEKRYADAVQRKHPRGRISGADYRPERRKDAWTSP